MAEEIEDRADYLNACAIKTLNRINKEIETGGLEKRAFRIDQLKFKASEYTAKQEDAERIEAKKYEHKIYNASC